MAAGFDVKTLRHALRGGVSFLRKTFNNQRTFLDASHADAAAGAAALPPSNRPDSAGNRPLF
jgi:hypothetical protein